MSLRHYVAMLHKGESNWGVVFPDFPGCVTVGDTLDEAGLRAIEALQGHIDAMVADNDPIPAPTPLDAVESDPEYPEASRLLVGVRVPTGEQRITITMDEHLVRAVDQDAARRGMSRSAFLAEGARRLLREHQGG